MASPPGTAATSPPGPSPLALPRQRPSLALPIKSRKPSIGSNTSSAHPLRQTSFPPPETLESQHAAAEDAHLRQFSPSQASPGSVDVSDSEITSAISGPAGLEDGSRKRKRGDKRGRGRGAKQGSLRAASASLVNGEDGTPASRRAAPSIVTADNGEDEDDEDDDAGAGSGRAPLYEGGQMSLAEYETDNKAKAMFRQYVDRLDTQPLTAPGRDGLVVGDMGDRYDVYNRAKLKTSDVRRLVNQTLSQSVPGPVVTVVSSYTKMFAGILIEQAREVQAEWLAVESKRPDGGANASYKRLKRAHKSGDATEGEPAEKHDGTNGDAEAEPRSSPTEPSTQPAVLDADSILPGGAGGLSTSIEECDRGPLLPDHLREALRRYRKSSRGGAVGFTGLSLEGRDAAAPRVGGRRLFR